MPIANQILVRLEIKSFLTLLQKSEKKQCPIGNEILSFEEKNST